GRGAGQGHRAAADPSSLHATTTKVARATRLGRPHRLERAALSANPQTSVSTPESPELYLEGEAFHRASAHSWGIRSVIRDGPPSPFRLVEHRAEAAPQAHPVGSYP